MSQHSGAVRGRQGGVDAMTRRTVVLGMAAVGIVALAGGPAVAAPSAPAALGCGGTRPTSGSVPDRVRPYVHARPVTA